MKQGTPPGDPQVDRWAVRFFLAIVIAVPICALFNIRKGFLVVLALVLVLIYLWDTSATRRK